MLKLKKSLGSSALEPANQYAVAVRPAPPSARLARIANRPSGRPALGTFQAPRRYLAMSVWSKKQVAQIKTKIGTNSSIEAKVTVTPVGLLAISVLVSSILVTTRLLVQAASKYNRTR